MAFCFNFADPNSHDHSENDDAEDCSQLTKNKVAPEPVQSREITPDLHKAVRVPILSLQLDTFTLQYLDSGALEQQLCVDSSNLSSVLKTVKSQSDLEPNVYEGGLKVWECAIDLLEYLKDAKVNFSGKAVLEVGCGAGLPGIFAILSGAREVHFQDYNSDVIENFTIPNVQLNSPDSDHSCTQRYFSGDWASFCDLQTMKAQHRFDVILTTETIYNVDNYGKLHHVFDSLLADDGVIYLAAKLYYFGVGGDVRGFEDFVQRKRIFSCEVCKRIEEGIPREILKLKRRNKEGYMNTTYE